MIRRVPSFLGRVAALMLVVATASAPVSARDSAQGPRAGRRVTGGQARLDLGEGATGDEAEAVRRVASYVNRGNPRRALELVRRLEEQGVAHAELTRLEAEAWVELGRVDRARPLIDEVVADRPGDPKVLSVLGRGLSLEGRFAEADEVLRLALDGSGGPAAVGIWGDIGSNLRLWGDPAAAEEAYRAALEDGGASPTLLCNLAISLLLQGRRAEAEQALGEAGIQGFWRPSFRLGMGMLAISRGELQEAAAWLRPIARRNDMRGTPRIFYADVLLRQGDVAEAARAIGGFYEGPRLLQRKEGIEGAGLPPVPRLHAVRAQILLAEGKVEEALEALAVAVRMDATDPAVLVARARVGAETGDIADARDACATLGRFGAGVLDDGEGDRACLEVTGPDGVAAGG